MATRHQPRLTARRPGADYAVFRRLYADLDRDDEAPWHRMFGRPDLVQNPMQLECQLAANGINVGDGQGYRHPRAAELAPGAEDWLLPPQPRQPSVIRRLLPVTSVRITLTDIDRQLQGRASGLAH